MKCKKKKKERKKNIETIKKLVRKYSNKIPLNELFGNIQRQKCSDSWFDIKESSDFDVSNKYDLLKDNKVETDEKSEDVKKVINCKKVILQPTDQQKKILLQWFESCRLMFNKTIRLIKERSFNKEKMILSFKTLRTYMLKEEKNKLIALYNTPSHILDGAIKLACASYKSAMSNLKQKNIRHFNVRYLKATKRSFIMDLEQCYFNKHSICPTKLGNLFKNKDDIAYDTIKSDCKIHYNTLTKRFTLLIPQKHDPKIRPESNDYVSVDPGRYDLFV